MMVCCKTIFVTSLFLLTLMVSARGDKDNIIAHMNVLYKPEQASSSSYQEAVRFTLPTFVEFMNCLCNIRTQTCLAHVNRYDVTDVAMDDTSNRGKGNSAFYNCILSLEKDNITCTKLSYPLYSPRTGSTCYQVLMNKQFECLFRCVGFQSTDNGSEILTVNKMRLIEKKPCEDRCFEAPNTTSSINFTSAIGIFISSPGAEGTAESSGDNTTVIVGVVIGILILAIVTAVVIFLLWRRGKCVFRSGKSRPNLSASPTENNVSGPTASYQHVHHHNGQSSLSSNIFSKQDLTSQGKHDHIPKKDHFFDVPGNNNHPNSPFSKSEVPDNDVDIHYGYSVAHALEPDNEVKRKPPSIQSGLDNVLGVDNVRTSDEFEYSMAEVPNSSDVDGHSGETSEGRDTKMTVDLKKTVGANPQRIPQQKSQGVGENTIMQLQPVSGTNLANEYDYAMPEADGDSVTEQSKTSVNTGTTDRSYEFCKLDGDNHSEDPDTKSRSVETGYALSEEDYADYSLSADTSPQTQHVYTKLGEKIRHTTNPYNVLLHPKEDPKKRHQLPPPASNTIAANQKSTYFFAHPISDNSTNPIAVINVDRPFRQNGAVASGHKDEAFSRSDFTLPADSDNAQNNKHTYYELEKQKDSEDSVSNYYGESF